MRGTIKLSLHGKNFFGGGLAQAKLETTIELFGGPTTGETSKKGGAKEWGKILLSA